MPINVFNEICYYKFNKQYVGKFFENKSYGCNDKIDDQMVCRGNGIVSVSDNVLCLSGSQPRVYISGFSNCEITFDYKYETLGESYAGCTIGVGLDEHRTGATNPCNTMYLRIRKDGYIDCEKEILHPASCVIKKSPYKLLPNVWNTIKYIFVNNKFQVFMKVDDVFIKIFECIDIINPFASSINNFIIIRSTNSKVFYKRIHVNQIII